jgi:hypothetical protein
VRNRFGGSGSRSAETTTSKPGKGLALLAHDPQNAYSRTARQREQECVHGADTLARFFGSEDKPAACAVGAGELLPVHPVQSSHVMRASLPFPFGPAV